MERIDINLRHYHGGNAPSGFLDFSANINPFGLPEKVKAALIENVDLFDKYPDPYCAQLRRNISRFENVPEEWIVCSNGAAEMIFNLVRAVKPKKAVLLSPGFYEYEKALAGIDVEYVRLREESGFRIGESLFKSLETADFFFFCNPHNPTGVLEKNVREIFKFCQTRGIFIAVDECFMDFCDSDASAKKYLYKRSALIKAFTKSYAMAGLRLGYMICPDTEIIERVYEGTPQWNVSAPAQAAGIAALNDKEYLSKSVAIIRREREFLKKEIKKAGCAVYGSEANFVFFKGAKELAEKCREDGIIIRDCSNYRGLGKGYFRAAVKKHDENERLLEVISKWQNQ